MNNTRRGTGGTHNEQIQKGIMKMMNEYKTLKDWMTLALMPTVSGAEKYNFGQNLTDAQAKEIMEMVAQSLDFDLTSASARQAPFVYGEPYFDFIVAYSLLMMQAWRENPRYWTRSLWLALSYWDQKTLARYFKKKFGLDIRKVII